MGKDNNGMSFMHVCSPVMDMTTADVWRLFSATDWDVSDMYEKMYEAGIPIENQRTGSLLHTCGTKTLSYVKAIEPDMYAKIAARFQNVEFMAQFSKSGYYKIGKPLDTRWNGKSHIKAGIPIKEVTMRSDLYEELLKKAGIKYTRKDNEFEFPKDKRNNKGILKGVEPLNDAIEDGLLKLEELTGICAEGEPWADKLSLKPHTYEELNEMISNGICPYEMAFIHYTWRDYALNFLNTTQEPLRTNWREKLVTSILSWKHHNGSSEDSTIDALEVLSELSEDIVYAVTDDYWTKEDFKFFGRTNISGKAILSISHYPQESLEKEALMCIQYLCEAKRLDLIKASPKLYELAQLWNRQGGKSLTPHQVHRNYIGKEDNRIDELPSDKIPKEGTDEFYNNVVSGAGIWFKENVHSTSSFKRVSIAMLKNDATWKYLGFGPTLKERMARAKAEGAFAKNKEEKEKAKAQAERFAKQIENEEKANREVVITK